MTDSLGYRANWGVIIPSTNTSVQPEFDDMRPRGVTNHTVRISIPDEPVNSDEEFNALMDNIRREFDSAILRVMTCNPDYIVMGMSAETFSFPWINDEGQTKIEVFTLKAAVEEWMEHRRKNKIRN